MRGVERQLCLEFRAYGSGFLYARTRTVEKTNERISNTTLRTHRGATLHGSAYNTLNSKPLHPKPSTTPPPSLSPKTLSRRRKGLAKEKTSVWGLAVGLGFDAWGSGFKIQNSEFEVPTES